MLKKTLFSGAFALLLSLTAQATLIGDDIDGTSSGITDFDDTDVLVSGTSLEFDGSVTGTGSFVFDAYFDFFAPATTDVLSIYIEAAGASAAMDLLNFSVTFSDLNWVGEPDRVLAGLNLTLDDPYGQGGAGLSGTFDDNSFTLIFTDFYVNEFRELEIELETEIDSTPTTPHPVPEPATVALLGMGLFGMALRKMRA